MQINLTTDQCDAILAAISRALRDGTVWEYRTNTLLVAHDKLLRAVAAERREKRERYRMRASSKRIAREMAKHAKQPAPAPIPVPASWGRNIRA